jgi:hypothetical protein
MYIKRNTEARLCNRCGSGNARSITFSESVFVALVMQNRKRMLPIVICGLSVRLYNIFPHYLIKARFSNKCLLNMKCVFLVSLQLGLEYFSF